MKATELKVGNLTKQGEIIGIYSQGVDTLFGFKSYKNIKPIPLTEQWLKKFGFEKDSINHWRPKSWFYAISQKNDGTFWFAEDECDPVVQIKYVHQIQNLYFALTGKELTIKQLENA